MSQPASPKDTAAAAAPASPAAAAAAASPPATGTGQTTEHAPIDVDATFARRDDDAGDSVYGDNESVTESTASLSSTIFNYRKVHGRTFQNYKDAEYWGPNDDKQNDALDLHHHMTLLVHNDKLHLAPIENPQSVLDVGTGTGAWAMHRLRRPIPLGPRNRHRPLPDPTLLDAPNCKFELDDASLDWTYPPSHFDFIHIRYLLGSIPDWPRLYAQAFRCLKPGGWLEHTDSDVRIYADDNSLPAGNNVYRQWEQFFRDAGAKTGRTFNVTENDQQVRWAHAAGFEPASMTLKRLKIPFGSWAAEDKMKRIGAYNLAATVEGLEGYGLYVGTQVLGWKVEELQVLIANMRAALLNPKYHAYCHGATFFAQKPL